MRARFPLPQYHGAPPCAALFRLRPDPRAAARPAQKLIPKPMQNTITSIRTSAQGGASFCNTRAHACLRHSVWGITVLVLFLMAPAIRAGQGAPSFIDFDDINPGF